MQEIREYTKEAGVEVGQRSEKPELSVKPAEPGTDYSKVPQEILKPR
jgi:hypothetical protein